MSDEARANISKSHEGKKKSPHTYEARRKMSSTKQGIPYEEWTGFSKNGEYCELFDDACRERIRAKYGYRCFACYRPQDDNVDKNGKCIKLAIHHIDRNKNQGCDGVQWKLIPLCMYCHTSAHYEPMKSRLEYLLNDEDV